MASKRDKPISEIDDESLMRELAEDFGVEDKPSGRSALEQRILAGFEEIERFVEQHGRLPTHGDGRDIFERLYAVRLDRLRSSPECRAVLKDVDTKGILGGALDVGATGTDDPDDAELASALSDYAVGDDVTKLVHVRTHLERQAAEEIAQRTPCADFEKFRPIFEQVQRDLDAGLRTTSKYIGGSPEICEGDLFIIGGQTVLVAKVIERLERFGPNGRVRVIYDNGTESEMLIRSLQRSMSREADANGRRISRPLFDPLFADVEEVGDRESGYIYVLRSKSVHPFIAEHRDLIHKIGVTGGSVQARIAHAKKDPTYLLADVELVATFRLANINRKSMESILHNFLSHVRLDLELKDRFGESVEPREWFLVPLTAIEEIMHRLVDGSICDYRYDSETARLVKAKVD